MRKMTAAIAVALLSASLTGCVSKHTMLQAEQHVNAPVNCATADADIRALENEKAHVAQQIAAGVSAVVPIGLVINVVRRTEKSQLKIAMGEYDKMLDANRFRAIEERVNQ